MNINKSIKTIITVIAFSLTICISCVDEYWPDLKSDYENLLVVDGKITNEPGPYIVKLSTSSSLQEPTFNPLEHAIVTITDDMGNSETLTEIGTEGVYKTSKTGIRGVIGRKYKLTIETGTKKYESEFEELLPPVGVESVNFLEETRFTEDVLDDSDTKEVGYQFYITTEAATNNINYYYWELEETYEYHSYYPITKIFMGELTEPQNRDSLFYCWTTNIVKDRFTQSTEYLSDPKIHNLPLHFVSFKDHKLRVKYSLLIKQFTVSKNAYTFLKGLQDQNSNTDDLYVAPPYQIRGNLINTQNPEEPVLGYFLTTGVSRSERIFTPPVYIISTYEDALENCLILATGFMGNSIDEFLSSSSPNDWPLYLAKAWVMVPDSHPVTYTYKEVAVANTCVDCRTRGGTTQKPEFWD